ncbi:MAG: Gfo/Idh/MocA family oxidoreductase [Candidatus Omnitrophota bacterium]
MDKIKVGLIGAGSIARKHLEVIRDLDCVEAVGITSRTMAKAEQLANDFGIRCCVDSADRLIHQAKPDALLVLVSEDQTFAVTASLIPYGLPLFIEKPAGLTPQENRRLASLAKKRSLKTMVGFNRRYYSIFRKGMEIIRKHGPLLGVDIEGHERIWRIHESTKFSKEVIAHWIFASSTHTIDLLRFFGGEPKKISAIAHSYKEPGGDQLAALLEFASGAIGQYRAYWYSPGGWKVVLYGDGATVEFKPLENGQWTDKNFNTHEIKPDDIDLKYKPGFFRQMEAFARLVMNGNRDWPLLDLAGACETMRLAERIKGKQ